MIAYAGQQDIRHRSLWEEYWADRAAPDAAGKLMDAFLPLVRKVFRRISIRLPSHVEREDLLQSALVGLFEAIERFDPERAVSFDAYASKRIRGAILDEMRRDDTLSRNDRAQIKKIKSAITDLTGGMGRAPLDEEISEKTGIELEKMRRLMEWASPMVYLDDVIMGSGGGSSISLKDLLRSDDSSPFDEAEKNDLLGHLCRAFKELADREQKVLYLYYREFLRLKEIAELFQLSEARICQIHSMALVKLRALIGSQQ
jgi:RNA polymerase sigma factor for flagellar operon FliA